MERIEHMHTYKVCEHTYTATGRKQQATWAVAYEKTAGQTLQGGHTTHGNSAAAAAATTFRTTIAGGSATHSTR